MKTHRYFTLAFALTGIGIAVGCLIGWLQGHTLVAAASTGFIVTVLGMMEISLSFDNAVANAPVLERMDEKWRRRFMTWGLAIAVVGMRVLFPLLIVAIAAGLGPVDAITLAITKPAEYAAVLSGARFGIAAFGGAFLLMVALSHFMDEDKDTHWIGPVERGMASMGRFEAIQLAISLAVIYGVSRLLGEHALTFLGAGVLGLVAFVAVEALGKLLDGGSGGAAAVRAGAGAFIYLEVMDSSLSFDGVIGAFALSNNLFVIAAGLGIGAAYVRSMTKLLVEKGTLATYPYLESGAFWAILVLACIMLAQTIVEIPELVTGLVGAGFIGAALYSSRGHNEAAANLIDKQVAVEA